MFSPKTLGFLEQEIKHNASNLENLTNICKDPERKQSIHEALLEERKYLLEQKSNHLDSVLHEAKNTPQNDTDVDKLCKDISELKTSVDNLFTKS